ncbi:MAG: hypothetical protein JW741_09775 [Sedimentisphaerales bacterium]|nr:hypothetical protein [Sedimentisphaerales bacterium]
MRLIRTRTRWDHMVVFVWTVLACLTLGAVGQGGRRRAREFVCEANLRRWGAMFDKYTAEHDGRFNRGWGGLGTTELWMNALRPYYDDQWHLLKCPMATQIVQHIGDSGTFRAWYRFVSLPEGGEYFYVSSYGINSWTNDTAHDRGTRLERDFWRTTENVENPATVPVFADSTWHDAWPRHTDQPPPAARGSGWGNTGLINEMDLFCIDRHGGGVNVLFMDWSVRKVGLKELWTLKWHRNYNTDGPWTKAGGVVASDWPQWMRLFKDY